MFSQIPLFLWINELVTNAGGAKIISSREVLGDKISRNLFKIMGGWFHSIIVGKLPIISWLDPDVGLTWKWGEKPCFDHWNFIILLFFALFFEKIITIQNGFWCVPFSMVLSTIERKILKAPRRHFQMKSTILATKSKFQCLKGIKTTRFNIFWTLGIRPRFFSVVGNYGIEPPK